MAAQEINERRRTDDVAADRAEGFAEGSLDHRRAMHDRVALGNAAAARPVKTDRVHLVEVGHRPELVGDIAVAESSRGVSPRAAHRSGLDTLASSGSCHRTKAAASRRELELLLLPVGSLPTSVTCPLRSTGIT